MIIKDLLDEVSAENIVDILIVCGKEKEKNRKAAIIGYTLLIGKLKEKYPKESDYMALGVKKINEFNNKEIITTSTIIVNKQKVLAYNYDQLKEMIEYGIENISDEKANYFCGLLKEFPDTYSLDFMDWSRVVGIEVETKNIEEYGVENVLANILYDMTFFGFSEDSIRTEKEKLAKSLEEATTMIEKIRRENEKNFYSIEEVFGELGLVDNRTKEEKEQAEKELRKRMFQNYVYKYHVLKEYKDGLNG